MKKLEGIDQLRHLIAVSMDGPSVNWKFLTELETKRCHQNLPDLLQVGSCALHVVHRSFECGHSSSAFAVDVILKAAYTSLYELVTFSRTVWLVDLTSLHWLTLKTFPNVSVP